MDESFQLVSCTSCLIRSSFDFALNAFSFFSPLPLPMPTTIVSVSLIDFRMFSLISDFVPSFVRLPSSASVADEIDANVVESAVAASVVLIFPGDMVTAIETVITHIYITIKSNKKTTSKRIYFKDLP